jgi:hypothetical protein
MLLAVAAWVPLSVAALGVLGTLTGTVVGALVVQRRADRREDLAWSRERDREREQWQREDQARTFEHRREACVDFYASLQTTVRAIYNCGLALGPHAELGDDWQFPTFGKFQHLKIYASPTLAKVADDAYRCAWRWGSRTDLGVANDKFYELQELYDKAEVELLHEIRAELSIPGE